MNANSMLGNAVKPAAHADQPDYREALTPSKGHNMRPIMRYLGDDFFLAMERLINDGGWGTVSVEMKPNAPAMIIVTQTIRGTSIQPLPAVTPRRLQAKVSAKRRGKPSRNGSTAT